MGSRRHNCEACSLLQAALYSRAVQLSEQRALSPTSPPRLAARLAGGRGTCRFARTGCLFDSNAIIGTWRLSPAAASRWLLLPPVTRSTFLFFRGRCEASP